MPVSRRNQTLCSDIFKANLKNDIKNKTTEELRLIRNDKKVEM